MGWVLPAASLISTGIGAVGAVQSGKAEQQQQEYNASIAEQNAQATREGAKLTEYSKRKAMNTLRSEQAMGYARSGVNPYTGSPLEAQLETLTQGELDIAVGNYNSEVQARGYQSEADMRRYYGKQAVGASYVKAGQTLLSGMTSFSSKYMSTQPKYAKVNGKTISVAPNDYYKTRIGE